MKVECPTKALCLTNKDSKKKLEKHICKRKECKRNWKKSASVCDEHSGQEFDDTYKRLKERDKKKDTKNGFTYIISHYISVTAVVRNISTVTGNPKEEKLSLFFSL